MDLIYFTNFIKITFRHRCSPVNLLHTSRTPFPRNTFGGLVLTFSWEFFSNFFNKSFFVTSSFVYHLHERLHEIQVWCQRKRGDLSLIFHWVRLRVRLHVTEMKSHPGMKKFLFTREFHPGMKRVEFHPGMKFNLKENLPLSMMKT